MVPDEGEGLQGTVILRLSSYVILGLDPRIHEETGTVPIERWIAGSKSGNDNKKEPGDDRYDRWRTFYAMLQRPRCSGRMCDGVCALNRERKKREKIPLLYLTLYLFFQSFKAVARGFVKFFRFGVIRFIRIRRNQAQFYSSVIIFQHLFKYV